MTPLHWGPLLPAVGYTAVFYSCPMQREEWFLAGMKWGAKSLRRAVSRVTCTAEVPVSASHQQPISILKVWHVPHPLPRQQQDFGHSWDACGLFLALCEGKKKSLKQRVELAFVCLPCHHFESPRGGCVVPLSAAVTHQARHRSWEHRGVLTSGGKGHHDVHESWFFSLALLCDPHKRNIKHALHRSVSSPRFSQGDETWAEGSTPRLPPTSARHSPNWCCRTLATALCVQPLLGGAMAGDHATGAPHRHLWWGVKCWRVWNPCKAANGAWSPCIYKAGKSGNPEVTLRKCCLPQSFFRD